ncbi:MAG: hypothetical protein JWP25_3574 [Bradyrhizobium sp.]|nr:hypothetical protein [Bradyrhizobium sp.]
MTQAKTEIEAQPKLRDMIWLTAGLNDALEALGGATPLSTLPGFILARALLEKKMADYRLTMSSEIYRAVARAGHDIGKVSSIFTEIKAGKPCILIEFADLVEQAEAEKS